MDPQPTGITLRNHTTVQRHGDPVAKRLLLEMLREGNHVSIACAMAGIDMQYFYQAMARGSRATDPHNPDRSFYLDVIKARASVETDLVAIIREAASAGSWKAAAWMLERLAPSRWRIAKPRDTNGTQQATPIQASVQPATNSLETVQAAAPPEDFMIDTLPDDSR